MTSPRTPPGDSPLAGLWALAARRFGRSRRGRDSAGAGDRGRASMQELRRRLKKSAYAVGLAFVAASVFAQEVFVLTAIPLARAWEARRAAGELGEATLYFASLSDPFFSYMEQSLWLALLLASPYVFYQLWMFVTTVWPPRRPRSPIALAAVSTLFFLAGAAFCYFAVMPIAFDFLLGYSTGGERGGAALRPALYMTKYLAISRGMILGFGIVFELPLLITLLVRLGVVTPRRLWRFNRWAILLAFSIGAVLTPGPDVLSQVLMAGALIVLYNGSIAVAFVTARRRERAGSRA